MEYKQDFNKYKAVLFDKDGTLIDVRYLWAVCYIGAFQEATGTKPDEEKLISIGIENGYVRPGAFMETATPRMVFDILYDENKDKSASTGTCLDVYENRDRVYSRFDDALHNNISKYRNEMKSISPFVEKLLSFLNSKGIKMGVITADGMNNTVTTMKQIGIDKYFSYYGTSDLKIPSKPNPDQGLDFCIKGGFKNHEVLMVGDTYNDSKFAENCGFDFYLINGSDSWVKLYAEFTGANE